MAVIGRFYTIVAKTGRTVEKNTFSSEYKKLLDVPIVDGAIKWENSFDGKNTIL